MKIVADVGNRDVRNSSVAAIPSTSYSYDQNDRLGSDGYDDNGNTTRIAIDNNITGIPCVLLYVDGKPAQIEIEAEGNAEPFTLDRLIGLRPAEHYEFIISKVMGTETD